MPVKINRNAIPTTIPGMVFVTSAMPSITAFSLLFRPLLAVARAAP